MSSKSTLNKYRGIIFAVSLFLLFNLAVLGLNFYTSSTLDNDAVSINLSGRQRMLSQRTTKVLLTMQVDAAQAKLDPKNTAELKKVSSLFDTTLNGFKSGGTVVGGDEKPVYLEKVSDDVAKHSVDEALRIWQPYKQLLVPVINSTYIDGIRLDMATDYARENNLKLLKLMNDLTTQLEKNTKNKARNLQLIQTIALVLSLLLFANIVFNALRKLRSADGEIEKAQRETTEILNTVKEGLFLLSPELTIGGQYSNSLTQILQHDIAINMPFLPLLQQLVSDETYESARDYITLLFGNRVKENLVASLNPLTEVKIHDSESDRYLNFQFNRVVENKTVLHLLVTVQDITKQVTQSQELAAIKSQANINLDLLSKLMQADQYQLKRFIASAENSFLEMNQLISELGRNATQSMDRINKCFRITHSIKGEAAALGLDSIQTHAHLFEILLVELKSKSNWANDDYLKLPVMLNSLLEDLHQVDTILDAIGAYNSNNNQQKTNNKLSSSISNNLNSLAIQVSQNQSKEVLLTSNLSLLDEMDEKTAEQVQQICIQLIRNGICHGIETPEVRLQKGKLAQGLITINTNIANDGAVEIAVHDDGQGIVPERIRAAMMRSGRYSVEAVAALNDKQIVNKLFEPGFSTASNVNTDAGHGVGMDVVQVKVKEMGATLNISSKPDQYTQFTLRIPYNNLNKQVQNQL